TSIETPAKFDQSATNFAIIDPSNVILDANMDSNPGFTTTGLFEYGAPVSPNQPAAAKTGTNIYDTDLDATCWTASTLTTKALDCSNHKDMRVEFWASAYVTTDYTIKFEVSNDNVNWTQLFSQAGLNSNIWVKYNYDISAVADGQRTVYVRWSMLGSGSQYSGAGLGIDDVKVTGNFVPADDIYLVTPNGGETWVREIPKQIRWTSGMGGNVKIELFKAGALNTTIAGNAGNDGSYVVVLPSSVAAATDYRIKITSVQQPSVSVMSAADFTVIAPSSNIFVTNLDTDPGFTTTGLFEYGTPISPNRTTAGKTGTKIYDTDLDATCFGNNTLTTTAIDCSNHTAVNLNFWAYAYMYAGYTFKVEVSNDNSTWTQLYSQAGLQNSAWVNHSYNISAVADGQPTVYVRWSMLGSGTQWGGGGLSIDDISITGTFTPTQYAYTVSYNGNGSTGGAPPVNQIKAQNIGLMVAPNSGSLVKTSNTFAGWNTAADGTGATYYPGDVYTANASTTLYAIWDAGGYTAWTQAAFTYPFTEKSQGFDPDGDRLTNLQEFAFGTDPTILSARTLAYTPGGEVTRAGCPIAMNFAAAGQTPDFRAVFLRRKNHAAAGLTYTVSFSADLSLWTASSTGLNVETNPGGASETEAVSIPFPATVPVQAGGPQKAPKFFRVGVSYN
ncbi:MAG TPA: InlB B-repeat-containing protein, partial [Luteolibacter sp.]|nr:InlB B-repeat-containing protein [Luteolibacter sp.]